MARVHIGKRSVQGRLDTYAQRFDLVEVRPDPQAPIRPAVLKKWRESVPAHFVFSVVLPPSCTDARGGKAALEHGLEVARVLQSPIILIATPASFTPTAANRKRLSELVAKIPSDVVRVAWEPAGLWEPDDAKVLALSLKVTLVSDGARESLAPGALAYTRLRGLGDARRMSSARLDRVIANLHGRRDAYVIIETDAASRVARALREGLAGEEGQPRVPRPRTSALPLLAEDEEQE